MRKVAVVIAVLAVFAGAMVVGRALSDLKRPLETAIAGADRIEIAPMWSEDQAAIFELRGEAVVEELVKIIEIDAWRSVGSCKCYGDTVCRFYRGDELLVTLGFAHGERLKWLDGQWGRDAVLTENSQSALPQWFKNKGYGGLEDARQSRQAEKRRQSE